MNIKQDKFCKVCGEENEILHEDFKDGDEVTWAEYFWISGRKDKRILSGKLHLCNLDGGDCSPSHSYKLIFIKHDKATREYLTNHEACDRNGTGALSRVTGKKYTILKAITHHKLNHHLDGNSLTAKEWYENQKPVLVSC